MSEDLTALAEYESDPEEDTLLKSADKATKWVHCIGDSNVQGLSHINPRWRFWRFYVEARDLKGLDRLRIWTPFWRFVKFRWWRHSLTSATPVHPPGHFGHWCVVPSQEWNGNALVTTFSKRSQGKTAVFVLSTLQQLSDEQGSDNVLALVLGHTRELVAQIHKEFDRLKKYLPGVKVHSACASVPLAQDVKALKTNKPHIVISTPGRALKLVEQKALVLTHLKHFILDECDVLLESLGMTLWSNVLNFKKWEEMFNLSSNKPHIPSKWWCLQLLCLNLAEPFAKDSCITYDSVDEAC